MLQTSNLEDLLFPFLVFTKSLNYLVGVIVRVRVVFRKTVVGDWCFDHLSGSHLQSQVKSRRQWYLCLWSCFGWVSFVVIWSSKHESCSEWSVVVLLLFLIRLLFVCWFPLRSKSQILTARVGSSGGPAVRCTLPWTHLLMALGAWPPTTYMTLGNPIGVRGRVLGDCRSVRWSLLKRWYFKASIKKSLQELLFFTRASVSTRLTRYSRDRRGRRTCSINCASHSHRCSGS